jgi:osmotically-inducible protein OsmY
MRYATLAWLLAITLLLGGCAAAIVTGAGVGVMAAEDRRTVATMSEDESIELKTLQRVSEKVPGNVHLNVTSYNRMVLLTGEAPNDNARRDIERIAGSVENVRGVTNELTVGAPTTLSSRANDSYVTSKVKARFVDASKFNPLHVKVVTENSTVFLLGLVKRTEAKDAIDVTRTTEGVRKVITVFEYLD